MQKASVWAEKVMIPTYEIGEAEKNPIFLEKRVYQGSSGKVYPYPTIEKISDEKKDKEYTAVWLENEYIKVIIYLLESFYHFQYCFFTFNIYFYYTTVLLEIHYLSLRLCFKILLCCFQLGLGTIVYRLFLSVSYSPCRYFFNFLPNINVEKYITDAIITIIGPVATLVQYDTARPTIPEKTENSTEKK